VHRALEEADPSALSLVTPMARGGFVGDVRVPLAIDADRRGAERCVGQVSAPTRWRRATRFDTMIIVMILVPGLGVIGRSQCSAHA
jgi:hypothetical protein